MSDELEQSQSVEGAAPEPSLAEALSATYDQLSDAADAPQGAGAQPTQPGERAASAPAPQQQAEQPQSGPARDENGRFIAKPAEAPQSTPKTELNGGQRPGEAQANAPIVPPASWSAAAKAEFSRASPVIQQEVLKREQNWNNGLAQREQEAARLNRLDSILAPRRDRFALAGIDEAQAVASLFAAQDVLERTPVDGLLYLGRQFGVNWQALFQRVMGQPAAQQPRIDPSLAPIVGQVQALTQTVQRREAADAQARRDEASREIDTFAADPANLYFANVRPAMTQLLATGQAKNLAEAYEKACWQDPGVRPLLIADQQRQAQDAAKAKAAEARRSSGSVTGSPTPGARPSGPKGTVADEMSTLWDQLSP